MNRGKSICRILKAIRQQVADANDISYQPVRCNHQGDCLGTCPACEAEVRYINQQLDLRRQLGKAVVIAGISAGLLSAPAFAGDKKPVKQSAKAKSGVKSTSKKEMVIGATGAVDARSEARADSLVYITPQREDDNQLFGVVEQMPSFPGGDKVLMEYLKRELVYPKELRNSGVHGRVIVTFAIEKDGRISSAKVVRSLHPALDAEALRVVNKMPHWIPGKQMGKAVRVKYTLPITFSQP